MGQIIAYLLIVQGRRSVCVSWRNGFGRAPNPKPLRKSWGYLRIASPLQFAQPVLEFWLLLQCLVYLDQLRNYLVYHLHKPAQITTSNGLCSLGNRVIPSAAVKNGGIGMRMASVMETETRPKCSLVWLRTRRGGCKKDAVTHSAVQKALLHFKQRPLISRSLSLYPPYEENSFNMMVERFATKDNTNEDSNECLANHTTHWPTQGLCRRHMLPLSNC